MPGSADEAGAAEAEHRPLLFSIAYGMTGSVGDAEDIVQDAFLGLTRARQAGTMIADPKAYLATAVTRLGINYLSSARVRRGSAARQRFIRITAGLTALSCAAPAAFADTTASKIALVALHLLAAGIIVPVLARHAD